LPARLRQLRDQLRTSYWFLPLMMTILAALVARILLVVDEVLFNAALTPPVLNVASTSAILSVAAGAIATIAGTTFSLMLVVLTLGSQQYGPLVVINFIRDQSNQVVFGMFTGTFVFCVITLEMVGITMRGVPYIPRITSLTAILLVIGCILVMIYFIHHIAVSIRPTSIINTISRELGRAIAHVFPSDVGQTMPSALSDADKDRLARFKQGAQEIVATESGYLNLIEEDALIALATEHHCLIEIVHRPGQFISKGAIAGRVYPVEDWTKDASEAFNEALVLSIHRSPAIDIELLFTQLVAIAVRALSPAINDPFTAMTCIDHLGEKLAVLANRHIGTSLRFDEYGVPRVITHPVTFDDIMHLSFDQIRHYGGNDLRVMVHMLNTIRVIGEVLHQSAEQRVLERYAGVIWGEARQKHTSEYAQEMLSTAYHAACARLRD
jgi:uncharacterized membrane protein